MTLTFLALTKYFPLKLFTKYIAYAYFDPIYADPDYSMGQRVNRVSEVYPVATLVRICVPFIAFKKLSLLLLFTKQREITENCPNHTFCIPRKWREIPTLLLLLDFVVFYSSIL